MGISGLDLALLVTLCVIFGLLSQVFLLLCRRIAAFAAPYLGSFLGLILPAEKNHSIQVAYGFHAAFWTDAGGEKRTANTFDEWLDSQPESLRQGENTFFNRVAFAIFKYREQRK